CFMLARRSVRSTPSRYATVFRSGLRLRLLGESCPQARDTLAHLVPIGGLAIDVEVALEGVHRQLEASVLLVAHGGVEEEGGVGVLPKPRFEDLRSFGVLTRDEERLPLLHLLTDDLEAGGRVRRGGQRLAHEPRGSTQKRTAERDEPTEDAEPRLAARANPELGERPRIQEQTGRVPHGGQRSP